MVGQGIIAPVLPLYARDFGLNAASIGLVVGVFGLARVFLNLPAGLLIQKFGRRNIMSFGLFLSAIGTALMGTSGDLSQLVLWRIVAGAGSAIYVTGSMSFIADISTTANRGRLMSLQQGSLLLGTDIGPIIGGVVADSLGFRWPFFLAGIFGMLAGIWIFFRIPEIQKPYPGIPTDKTAASAATSRRVKKNSRDLGTIKTLLANPTFLLVGVFTLLVFFTRSGSRQTLLPLAVVEQFDISATQLGFLFAVMTTINLIMVLPAGSLTDRFGRKAVVLPGAMLSLIGLSMFGLGGSMWMFYLAAVILGLGTGVIGPAPAAYAGDLAPPGKTGVTMGLYRSFGDIGLIGGPILLGLIADAFQGRFEAVSGPGVAMIINAALLLFVAVILVVAAKETAGRKR